MAYEIRTAAEVNSNIDKRNKAKADALLERIDRNIRQAEVKCEHSISIGNIPVSIKDWVRDVLASELEDKGYTVRFSPEWNWYERALIISW